MHAEARAYVTAVTHGIVYGNVVEFGSRNVNGTIRDEFTQRADALWMGVDLAPGLGVDVVSPAEDFIAAFEVDCIVCCEMLEHTPNVRGVIESAHANLRNGGTLIITCATDPRAPHSAVDGGDVRDGEHYANVGRDELLGILHDVGFQAIDCTVHGRGDLYVTAIK